MSALKLPAGVTVVMHGKTDPVVAAAVVPKAQVEEVVEAEAAGRRGRCGAAAAGPEGATPEAQASGKGRREEGTRRKDDKKK